MAPTDKLDPAELPHDQSARVALAQELRQKALTAAGRGELLVATLHATDALMLFPSQPELLDTFDRVVTSVGDPLSLLPVATGAIHVATAAGRARVLLMQRRVPEALELLAAVLRVAPELAYFPWIEGALTPQALAGLTFDALFSTVVRPALTIAGRVSVPAEPDDEHLPNVRSAAATLAAVRARFPQESVLWFAEVVCRRRLGDAAATLAVAREGAQRFPGDWGVRTAHLNALRDAGRPDEALGEARQALTIQPDDCSPLHDAAWAFADQQRFQEASQLFAELGSRDADYPGGRAAYHYTRWKAFQQPDDRAALVHLRERDPDAARFADELDPPEPYFNVLPLPGDATASAVRHLSRELGHVIRCCGQGGRIHISMVSRHLEAPSAAVAFELSMRSFGAQSASFDVEVEDVQQPDPRGDKAATPFRLWSYQGQKPQKAYPQGEPRAQAAIAELAQRPFRRDVWDPAAKALAAATGPDWVHALLSVVTSPPLPPEGSGFDPVAWTLRCQIAVALVLSHLEPWEQGPGRAALYSMAYGPSDWATSAAIVAFGFRALESPARRQEAEALFSYLRSRIPKKGYTAYEPTLLHVWRGLGGHPEALARELDAWRNEFERTVRQKNVARPPVRRYGGLTLDEYATFSAERDKLGVKYQGRLAAVMDYVAPTPAISALCAKYGIDPSRPYVPEWNEAMNADPELMDEFIEAKRTYELRQMGVSSKEKAALDEIRDGNMDMHLRMAQAQEAQRAVREGDGDPDPVVFPGQPVAKLSDYVKILKGMQGGDMNKALKPYGLTIMSYAQVAQAWGAKMAADPVLTEKFSKLMAG
jgi:tetratricopeptide (TPR) repeat protein